MKKIIFSIIIISIIHTINAQVTSENDWHKMNLIGKAKSIRETSYKAVKVSDEIRKGKRKRENSDEKDLYILFNDKGKMIEETEYNSDGKIYRKFIHLYDDKEYPNEVDCYDSKGNLTIKHKYINNYDNNGKLSDRTHFKPDGTIDNKYTYNYNDKLNLIEYNWFKRDGSLNNKEIFKYDDKGNMLEDETYKPDGKLDWRITYKYDASGNNVEENTYKGTKFIIKYFRKYDQYRNQVEIDWAKENGKIYEIYFMKYDYDKQGNWTKQTQFHYQKPTYIYERELGYF